MKRLIVLLICAAGFSVAGQEVETAPYFPVDSMPYAGIYLPAPPDTCSPLFTDDLMQWMWGKSMRATERGQRASWESLYSYDRMCEIYSQALGFTVSREATPAIYRLITRGQVVSAQAVDKAKAKYMRKRPFARMNEHVGGEFDDEEDLRGNGSYPSGHTSFGWVTAMMLAQMAPELQDTILRRGWEYGESRVIVGAHWQSDVDAARLAASACMARVQGSAEYQADLEAARTEFLLRSKGALPEAGYPDFRRVLPPPVDTTNLRFLGDVEAHWVAKNDRQGARGAQAIADAASKVPDFMRQFSACLDMQLDTATAPHVAAYLSYVRKALHRESKRLKRTGFRSRPFVRFAEPTTIPGEEASHASNTSYPSSHSTLGWGMAMAMVVLTPDSMDALLQRGYEYGQSRVVAGYHWASDVEAGRIVASCTLLQLVREPRFRALADSARAEYYALRGHPVARQAAGRVTLRQAGNRVRLGISGRRETGILRLYDGSGQVVRSLPVKGSASLSLAGLSRGKYVATFTGRTCFRSLELDL